MNMGAGKLRVVVHRGGSAAAAAIAVAAAVAGCGSAVAATAAAGQSGVQATVQSTAQPVGQATPTVVPSPAPVLGAMTLGTFPATLDGIHALTLCEQWAGLRADYVSRLSQDTPFQLEQWFSSSPQWLVAFNANSPLKTDTDYIYISTAFGLVSTAAAASVSSGRLLDQACAAAD